MKDFVKCEALIVTYEVYGKLLTEKQQQYFEWYFFDDYSLGEIAELSNVSRSAVFDSLTKISKRLDYFENNLQIIKNSNARKKLLAILQTSNSQNEIQLIVKKLLLLEEENKGDEEN